METEELHKATPGFSERLKRSLINQLAHRLSRDYYRQVQERLQAQLDQAEMRGCDGQVLAEWVGQLQPDRTTSADACAR